MRCHCGAGLPETAKFCVSCGAKVEVQSAGEPPAGSGGVGDIPGTGKMSWSISLPIFKNTVFLKQLGLAIGIPLALVAMILVVASGDGVYALYGLALIGALLFFIWLFLMIVCRGRYEMDFILDDNGAFYRNRTGQAKKNRIVNTPAVVPGLLSGKPAAVGAGMPAQSRQEELLPWNRISRVSYKPRRHTVLPRRKLFRCRRFCQNKNKTPEKLSRRDRAGCRSDKEDRRMKSGKEHLPGAGQRFSGGGIRTDPEVMKKQGRAGGEAMFDSTCKKGRGWVRSYPVIVSMAAVVLISALLLGSCGLLLPTPTDEQILQAVAAANEAGADPLELDYGGMKVPQRLPGKALAILWVSDKSIQRNFSVVYDREEQSFHVESCSTQLLGEDGVYRD